MIGLSTTYYANQGLSIYESVLRTVELGFKVVELGTAHEFEEDVWQVLRKIRKDFKRITFTIHNLFPPQKRRVWFNPADGLNSINKEVVDQLCMAASIMEANLISIHPPVLNEVSLGNRIAGNFIVPVIGRPKDSNKSKENFNQLMEYIKNKIEGCKLKVIIENLNISFVNTLISSKNNFLEIFDEFANTGLLLDVGHALQCGNLCELLELDGNIFEMHLHDIKSSSERRSWGHFPIKDKSYFEPLKKFLNRNSVPLIFEHGADVSENEILEEKQLLERYISHA